MSTNNPASKSCQPGFNGREVDQSIKLSSRQSLLQPIAQQRLTHAHAPAACNAACLLDESLVRPIVFLHAACGVRCQDQLLVKLRQLHLGGHQILRMSIHGLHPNRHA